jgi:hypothetical protein
MTVLRRPVGAFDRFIAERLPRRGHYLIACLREGGAMTQLTDTELLDAFLSQDDRLTHSGMMLSDCFTPSQFDLVFEYGSVFQKSAVRQALIACLSLPTVERGVEPPPRNATFEKHLENLLLHALRSISADEWIPRRERAAASLLVEAAAIRKLPHLDSHTPAPSVAPFLEPVAPVPKFLVRTDY